MKLKSPLKTVGGKFYYAEKIISLFPLHKCYCEVFGGAGHVLFAKPPSKIEVFNDLNENIFNFFMITRDEEKSKKLIKALSDLPYSFKLYQQWVNEPLPEDEIERITRWFYILILSFGAKYGGSFGYSIQRNHAKSFHSAIERIKYVKERFKYVILENRDFREILKRYDSPDTLFYLDPPYHKVKQEYYSVHHHINFPPFTEKDHHDLAELLKKVKGKVILSYFPTKLIMELYNGWNFYYFDRHQLLLLTKVKQRKICREVIITNFEQNLLWEEK